MKDQTKRIVLLLDDMSPSYEHHIKVKFAKIFNMKDLPYDIEFRKIARTHPAYSFRFGFQEYRIALELSPDLIVTEKTYPWDAVFANSGIPLLELEDKISDEIIKNTLTTLSDSKWTYSVFSKNIVPEKFKTAEKITILGTGSSRSTTDEGLVLAMSPIQMFSQPEPDYFINEEFIFKVPIYQEGSTIIANKWSDTVDMNAVNLPFTFENNHEGFWKKGIDRRCLARAARNTKCEYLIWSPYPQTVVDSKRLTSPILSIITAIRSINIKAEIIYKWKGNGFEVGANELMEQFIIKQNFGPAQVVHDNSSGTPEGLNLFFEQYDLDLTHAGAYISNWLLASRGNALDATSIFGAKTLLLFLNAQGFSSDLLNPKTQNMGSNNQGYYINIAPARLYPT